MYLSECLESISNQSYKNWECVVVDNGSTDNTRQVTESFIQKDKRFKYIYTEQKGVSFARNHGIKSSIGNYILPVDADDKIAPYYIEKAIEVLERDKNVKLIYCNAKLFGAFNKDWILPEFSLKNILIENIIFCSALYRRKDYDQTNGYNEQMVEGFEDWDFWLDLLRSGGEVVKLPETFFYYRIKKDSRNHALDFEKQKRLREKIYQNHKELYSKILENSDFVFEFYNLQNKYKELTLSRDLEVGKKVRSYVHSIKKLFRK